MRVTYPVPSRFGVLTLTSKFPYCKTSAKITELNVGLILVVQYPMHADIQYVYETNNNNNKL